MNLFDLIYRDDAVSLAFLIAIFYVVGANMADDTVRLWGWRAAAVAYVGFVIYAIDCVGPTRASQMANIAFRGLFAGGLSVGTAWILLAIALFLVRELKNVEEIAILSPVTSDEVQKPEEPDATHPHDAGGPPTDWKPKERDFSKLPKKDWQDYLDRRHRWRQHEADARILLIKLRAPSQPSSPPPGVVERRSLQTQLDELELARQFITVSGEDPQEIGRMLAECNGRLTSIKKALGQIPPDKPIEPELAGVAVLDEAIARRPQNPALYVERAKHFATQFAYQKAVADCKYALRLDPTYYAAFNIRGFVYHRLAKYSAAVHDFERSIYEYPLQEWAYASLAATYNAARCYREALGPAYYASLTNFAGHNQLAIAYEHLSEHDKAVHHLTRVIQADPNAERVPNARVRRAKQLMKLGQTELAKHDLKTHLVHHPDSPAGELLKKLENLSVADLAPNDDPTSDDPSEFLADQLGAIDA